MNIFGFEGPRDLLIFQDTLVVIDQRADQILFLDAISELSGEYLLDVG